jgi:hypothetical protein
LLYRGSHLARRRLERKGRQREDLTLRVAFGFLGSAFFYVFFAAFGGLLGMLGRLGSLRVFVGLPSSLGACGAYVFVAPFGGLLRMLWPLFGHPDLLLIVRGVIVPWEPNFTPRSPTEAPAHPQLTPRSRAVSLRFWLMFA